MNNTIPTVLSKKNNNHKQKELAVMIEISALEDPRFFLLLEKFGIEGVGIYFVLILQMRRLDDFGLSKIDIAGIAVKFRVDKNKIIQLLDYASSPDVGLFRFEQNRYFSVYLCEKMEDYQGICEKNQQNGSKGGRAKAEREASERLASASDRLALAKRPVSDPNLIQSNLIQSNLIQSNLTESKKIESKILDQDLNTNSELAQGQAQFEKLDFSKMPKLTLTPEMQFKAFELSEKAKKFASALKIDLEPKKVEEVPKVAITEVMPDAETERIEAKQPDETEKTTESIEPPTENSLMAKFGSFDLPEDLQKFSKAVEAELDVPDGQKKWEISSQYILAGRRPVKKYMDIWFSPIELAQVAAEYDKNGVLKEMKTALRLVQTRLDDLKAQNKNTEFKGFTGWMLGFILNDLLDKKIKKNILEKQEARK